MYKKVLKKLKTILFVFIPLQLFLYWFALTLFPYQGSLNFRAIIALASPVFFVFLYPKNSIRRTNIVISLSCFVVFIEYIDIFKTLILGTLNNEMDSETFISWIVICCINVLFLVACMIVLRKVNQQKAIMIISIIITIAGSARLFYDMFPIAIGWLNVDTANEVEFYNIGAVRLLNDKALALLYMSFIFIVIICSIILILKGKVGGVYLGIFIYSVQAISFLIGVISKSEYKILSKEILLAKDLTYLIVCLIVLVTLIIFRCRFNKQKVASQIINEELIISETTEI